MDTETAQAARLLAEHALLLLAAGIVIAGLALAGVLAAARFAERYGALVVERALWIAGHVGRVPALERVLTGTRVRVPTSYVVLHLVLGFAATAAVMGFAIIAEDVVAGREVAAFDLAFARALRDSASPRWQQVFRIVTSFGSGEVLLVPSAVIAVVLLRRRASVLAIGWTIGQAGGALLNILLKNTFERTRPEFAEAFLLSPSWSFPSGHAMSTFVFCGLGVYLLSRSIRSWTTLALVVTVAFAWCLLMGFTRLYLGVHYVSDVVAGLLGAAAWVAVCVSGIEVALRRAGSNRA